MSKKSLQHHERRRHLMGSLNNDSKNNTNCASLSCDVDARISCGGKTFQSKLIGSDGKDHYRKSIRAKTFKILIRYIESLI